MNVAEHPSGDDGGRSATAPPLITEFKGNSLDDGPGVRSVVFFKGCPLSCVWCHNPETKSLGPELSFDAGKCIGVYKCVPVCDQGALDPDRPGFVDRDRCNGCMRCVGVCPSEALSFVGREWTVDELAETIERYVPFYRNSGGGLTLSGGEATLHSEFCGRLLRRVKELGVHTLLETSGQFNLARYREHMQPWLDSVYFDLKLMDDDAHRRYCGVPNRTIHENFHALLAAASEGGPEVLARVPLVPGITATDENLAATARFLRESGADRVELLAYNPLWREKAANIGAAVEYERSEWMSRDEIAHCRGHFAGLEVLG